jgi:hypothetical protein
VQPFDSAQGDSHSAAGSESFSPRRLRASPAWEKSSMPGGDYAKFFLKLHYKAFLSHFLKALNAQATLFHKSSGITAKRKSCASSLSLRRGNEGEVVLLKIQPSFPNVRIRHVLIKNILM